MTRNDNHEIRKWHTLAILSLLLLFGIILIFVSAKVEESSKFWGVFLRDIGFVFAPVAAIALLYDYFAEKRYSKYLANQVTDVIIQELGDKYYLGHKELLMIYPNRLKTHLSEFFNSANQRIDILTTNLKSLDLCKTTLVQKASNGIKVRVLTLNPTHGFLRSRYKELGFTEPKLFYNEMITALRHFVKEENNISSYKNNYKVKIHQSSPTLMLFRSDDKLILGFILRQGRASDFMHIEFNCSEKYDRPNYSQCFIEHFDTLWKEAEEVDSHNINKIEWKD
ncbi:MAG TPA: hypothetical protein VJ201_09200 [Candidatus Babeliales bacterium]|nr:hypothetical protein [Candidatus Babeliales bacterium]